jgi:hypothetical protein
MNNREWIWSLETGSQTDRNRHSRLRFSLFVVYDGTGDEQVTIKTAQRSLHAHGEFEVRG